MIYIRYWEWVSLLILPLIFGSMQRVSGAALHRHQYYQHCDCHVPLRILIQQLYCESFEMRTTLYYMVKVSTCIYI